MLMNTQLLPFPLFYFHILLLFFTQQANKVAGFLYGERDAMTELLSRGFVDVYRHFFPTERDIYTFWTYFGNARAKNMGWRLDYFIVSSRLLDAVKAYWRRPEIKASEFVFSPHFPFFLFFFKICNTHSLFYQFLPFFLHLALLFRP